MKLNSEEKSEPEGLLKKRKQVRPLSKIKIESLSTSPGLIPSLFFAQKVILLGGRKISSSILWA
jgi:hypothetical protein